MVVRPTTRLGTWAVGLALANILLMPAWRLFGPLGGWPGLVAGFAGGVLALVAIARRRERSLAAYAALVPFALVVLFVLAELLIGHD
jgi:peptidoglycan/LPS O-acetylase OafA/YrhL